nr:ATP synthase F0 subunit 8 [Folsomia candida]
MPQMAPIMWTTMFFVFSSLFLMTMIKIYSTKNCNLVNATNQDSKMSEKIKMDWKW